MAAGCPLEERLLIRLRGGVIVQRELQLGSIFFLGRGDGEPAERPLAEIGLLSKAQHFGIEAQRLLLVIHKRTRSGWVIDVLPWITAKSEFVLGCPIALDYPPRMRSTLTLLSTIVVSCVLTGCVKNRPFQLNVPQPIGPPVLAKPLPASAGDTDAPASLGYKVGIVEFDDMGELWDRCSLDEGNRHCQLREVLAWVEKERVEAEREKAQPVTIVFVHGWHHNANPRDENLNNFQEKVYRLQHDADGLRAQCQSSPDGPRCDTTYAQRKVRFIGVYLAWRARTLKAPKHPALADPDYLAFFDRETTAMRASLVSMSETFLRLRAASESPEGAAYASRFIIVGHSFGGLIVERVISDMLTQVIVGSADGGVASGGAGSIITCSDQTKGYRPLADLVILLNPASDGILTEQTIDMLKRAHARTCANSTVSVSNELAPPLILSLTSAGDSATGFLYKIGHGISQIHMAFRDYRRCGDFCGTNPSNQRTLYLHTAGHMPFFHNYCYLDGTLSTGDPICDQEQEFLGHTPTVASPAATAGEGGRIQTNPAAIPHEEQVENLKVFQGSRSSPQITASGAQLGVQNLYRRCVTGAGTEPDCNQNWNDTPYWILSVPSSLSKNHDDIWNDTMSGFLGDLIDATTPAAAKMHTAIQ
jgi:hypothetical protein